MPSCVIPNPDDLPPWQLPRVSPPHFSSHSFPSTSSAPGAPGLNIRIWPADPSASGPAPWIIWIHGGAYDAGNHYAPLAWLDPGFRQRGWHLLSTSYRLGPQARLDESVADCLKAVTWAQDNLPKILGEDKVDVDRYVVCGESAGGTLATLVAHHAQPPPKAVISAYGLVDFIGLMTPGMSADGKENKHPNAAPQAGPKWDGEFSESELDALLDDRDPANGLTEALIKGDEKDKYTEAQLREWWATEIKFTRRQRLQAELHIWRSQRRAPSDFLRGVFHGEKFADRDSVLRFVTSLSATRLITEEKGYPPTAFLHGKADVDVPVTQSQDMAKRLREVGVETAEAYEEGMPHVFDNKYTGSNVPGWDFYIQPILDFVNKHAGYRPN